MKTHFEPSALNLDDSFSNFVVAKTEVVSMAIPKSIVSTPEPEPVVDVIMPFKPISSGTTKVVVPATPSYSPPLVVTTTPTYTTPVATTEPTTTLATSSLDSPSYGGGGGGGSMPSSEPEAGENQEAKVGGGAVVASKKILGMKPILFYSLLAVVIGYGYYRYKKSK
jgi:hypothetical protein